MKKINFKEFPIRMNIGSDEVKKIDTRESIGNAVYHNAAGVRGLDLAIEKVCRLIKKVRTENHINDHEATSIKIRKSLRVIHDDRNSKFDTFTYKGKPLSSYCDEEWIEQVAKVVESEIYHVDGENNARAASNVTLAYENIKTEFYAKMKD